MHRAALFIVVILAASSIGGAVGYYSRGNEATKAPLSIITASLYTQLLESASKDSGIKAVVQGMGAVQAARQLMLVNGSYDLFVSVDPFIISSILEPRYASWYVAIASDSMAIGYSSFAPDAKQIEQLARNISLYDAIKDYSQALVYTEKVLNIIFSSEGKIGISNPNTDPEGYRALMLLQLAGLLFYNNQSYYTSLLQRYNETGNVVELNAGSQLLSYLQSGEIDYDIALYLSSARQAGVDYITLPPQLSLGDANFSSLYSMASVTIHSGGTAITIKGAPIFLSVTVPSGAKDQDLAAEFILFLISQQGKALMTNLGILPLTPAVLYGNVTNVPPPLLYVENTSILQVEG
ncbi:MAG: substrate-binding domain-containing protein [Conexivisphaerales archaeon]